MSINTDMMFRALETLSDEETFEFLIKVIDTEKLYRKDWISSSRRIRNLEEAGLVINRGSLFEHGDDHLIATLYAKRLMKALIDSC